MSVNTDSDVYFDPWDVDIYVDPYPVYRRLRDEAPLYYNELHDFFVVSRYDDIERVLSDRRTFLSCRGDIVEMIKAGVEMPPGTLIFEEPPAHTIHRALLSRVFSPKRISDLEPRVRDFCVRTLEKLAGADRFDFVADLGAQVPMRVIGMLLGIPESDQEMIRDITDDQMRGEAGKPAEYAEGATAFDGALFAEYIDWRYEHPSDDLMTDLLRAEFEDETGVRRQLTRDEVLTYITVLSGAGNETTNRLIGWTGKLLAEHPDARHALVADRALVPNAIEEILRYEPIPYTVSRYVATDTELHGTPVPAGSAIATIPASGNRDERHFPEPDRFDIHRRLTRHLSFGYGAHFCLGAALARLEGRVVLDEVLTRFTDWEVDDENTVLRPGANRGWDALPVIVTAR